MNFIDLLISAVLALIMFGIGASLEFRDFSRLFKDKKSILLGLALQMVGLPLLAFIIASLSTLPPAFQAGLFILAICPGGTTSNFISYIVKADVALSIALTSINSILILVSIPLLSHFAMSQFMGEGVNISVTHTFSQVLLILFLPALLGILFNEGFSNLSERLQNPLKYINSILLAIVFAIKFFADTEEGGSGISLPDVIQILPYALLLHLGSMLGSYFLAKRMGVYNLRATTIGIEVGLQNTALALLVSGTLIGNDAMTKPPLVAAIFSFFTTLSFAYIAMRYGDVWGSLWKRRG